MVREQKQGPGEGMESGRGTNEKQPVVHRHSHLGCLLTGEGFAIPMSLRHWGLGTIVPMSITHIHEGLHPHGGTCVPPTPTRTLNQY